MDTVGQITFLAHTGKDTVGLTTFSPWTSLYRGRFTQDHLKCWPKLSNHAGQETKERFIRSENNNNNNNNNNKITTQQQQ